MRILFFLLFGFKYIVVIGQSSDSLEIINGPEKYKTEVVGIYNTYSKILDSIQNDRIKKMSKDSLYAENEMKNRPKKYKGYDGGIIGYLMNEKDQKIKEIINRFLKIDRITSSSKWSSGNGPVHYEFNYSRTNANPNGTSQIVLGKAVWQDD